MFPKKPALLFAVVLLSACQNKLETPASANRRTAATDVQNGVTQIGTQTKVDGTSAATGPQSETGNNAPIDTSVAFTPPVAPTRTSSATGTTVDATVPLELLPSGMHLLAPLMRPSLSSSGYAVTSAQLSFSGSTGKTVAVSPSFRMRAALYPNP